MTCRVCGSGLISQSVWANLSADQRAWHRAQGTNALKARSLCSPCYERMRVAGTLIDHDRTTRPWDEVRDDLDALGFSPRLPRKQQFRNLAPRIGMNMRTLETAWCRANH